MAVATPVASVVLRARNDEHRIARAVLAVDEQLKDLGLPYEIIVADSASTDATAERVLAMRLERVRVVRSDRPGRGRVLSAAIVSARGPIVGVLDLDLALVPDVIRHGVHSLLRGADGAIGSYVRTQTRDRRVSSVRRAGVAMAFALLRWTIGSPTPRRPAGVSVFRREALLAVLPDVRASGWLWEIELLATLSIAGARLETFQIHGTRPKQARRIPTLRPVARAGAELPGLCIRVRRRRNRFATLHSVAGSLTPAR